MEFRLTLASAKADDVIVTINSLEDLQLLAEQYKTEDGRKRSLRCKDWLIVDFTNRVIIVHDDYLY